MKPEYSVHNTYYTKSAQGSQPADGMATERGIVCAVVGCLERRHARRFCRRHYVRWRQADPDLAIYVLGLDYRTCRIQDCGRPHKANRLCQKHYMQKRRRGHPLARTRAEKGTGDPRNRHYHNGKPRPVVWVNGTTKQESRHVWESHYGQIPAGYHIHHVNRDPLDNRIDNLECLSPEEHLRRHGKQPRRRSR